MGVSWPWFEWPLTAVSQEADSKRWQIVTGVARLADNGLAVQEVADGWWNQGRLYLLQVVESPLAQKAGMRYEQVPPRERLTLKVWPIPPGLLLRVSPAQHQAESAAELS